MGIKKRIQYRYTPTGQKSLMIDPNGGRHTYLYDNVKQLSQIINPQGERTTFAYDAAGRRTVKKLANGSRTSFTYDVASRVTSVAHLKSDGSEQARFGYKYDKVGNRKGVAELDGSRVTYLYDVLDKLVGEHRTGTNPYRNTFTYDNRGNRTLKNLDGARTTATYDDANQLTWTQDAGGRTTYIYDGNGNQEVTIAPSGARTTNVWDYENRLIGVLHPSGSRETMAYDPDGKRVQHETGAATTKYVWNGQAYLLETDASGVTVATYTNEPTTYGRLISQRKSGATHFYVFDGLGSTRMLTDASQNVAESLLYDAWGNLVGSAPSMAVLFRWIGELGYLFVSTSGDYYIRERILRPTIGRWMSTDPIRFARRHTNLYHYVKNRVVALVDPSGADSFVDSFDISCCSEGGGGSNPIGTLDITSFYHAWLGEIDPGTGQPPPYDPSVSRGAATGLGFSILFRANEQAASNPCCCDEYLFIQTVCESDMRLDGTKTKVQCEIDAVSIDARYGAAIVDSPFYKVGNLRNEGNMTWPSISAPVGYPPFDPDPSILAALFDRPFVPSNTFVLQSYMVLTTCLVCVRRETGDLVRGFVRKDSILHPCVIHVLKREGAVGLMNQQFGPWETTPTDPFRGIISSDSFVDIVTNDPRLNPPYVNGVDYEVCP